ncbi:MAG TPA: hypothetical protein VG759_05045, partial [Candidatus Angelobacter sp.]|nr:hypothetical protein [Candidatus Angelobacter sp.]
MKSKPFSREYTRINTNKRGCKRDCVNGHRDRRIETMAIEKELVDQLLAGVKTPEDITGEDGLLK